MAYTETARKKFRVMASSTPGVAAGLVTITPASILTGALQTNNIGIPGVRIGDAVFVQKQSGAAGLLIDTCVVNALNQVSLRLINVTGGTIAPAAMQIAFFVIRN